MVVKFSDGIFGTNKQRPLSKLMVASLIVLCAKQKDRVPLSYEHAQGSFSALVARGLVVSKDVITDGEMETIWVVTRQAIDILKKLGFEVPV